MCYVAEKGDFYLFRSHHIQEIFKWLIEIRIMQQDKNNDNKTKVMV